MFVLLPRALSEVQETAQLLTGSASPESILASFLQGAAENMASTIGVINLSPYDSCLEKVCLRFHLDNAGKKIRCLSLGTDVDVVLHNQKLVAMYLMEERCFHIKKQRCFSPTSCSQI